MRPDMVAPQRVDGDEDHALGAAVVVEVVDRGIGHAEQDLRGLRDVPRVPIREAHLELERGLAAQAVERDADVLPALRCPGIHRPLRDGTSVRPHGEPVPARRLALAGVGRPHAEGQQRTAGERHVVARRGEESRPGFAARGHRARARGLAIERHVTQHGMRTLERIAAATTDGKRDCKDEPGTAPHPRHSTGGARRDGSTPAGIMTAGARVDSSS
jgi:hypothetical protein